MEEILVEIWSDIRCPFCYLGKKRFEAALNQFKYKSSVNVEWHSFELDPFLVTQPSKNAYDHLAEKKRMSREQSVEAHQRITLQARQLGLEFNFDKAVVANSFNAHRLGHLAKTHNLEDEMHERLFKAYFTEGTNISDDESLLQIGKEAGLPENELKEMLKGDLYSDNVRMDEANARELGISGVPFFLFNGKLAVTGAQPPETFLMALHKAWDQMKGKELSESKTKTFYLRDKF